MGNVNSELPPKKDIPPDGITENGKIGAKARGARRRKVEKMKRERKVGDGVEVANRLTRKITVSLLRVRLNLLLSKFTELYSISTIYFFCQGCHLFLDAGLDVVEELEVGFTLANSDSRFGKGLGSSTSFGPMVAHNGGVGTRS